VAGWNVLRISDFGKEDLNVLKLLKSKRGEGYIDVCVLVLCSVLVIALAVKVFTGSLLLKISLILSQRSYAEKQKFQEV